VIAGLKLETTRGEILKGIVEAATFYLRDCFEGLPGAGIDIRRVHGGGRRQPVGCVAAAQRRHPGHPIRAPAGA
jgi:sugar (pentulose or hexulose) kinase